MISKTKWRLCQHEEKHTEFLEVVLPRNERRPSHDRGQFRHPRLAVHLQVNNRLRACLLTGYELKQQ